MDVPSDQPAPCVLPRIYIHFMAFSAMSLGYFYKLAVMQDWHRVGDAVHMILIAWFPPLVVEYLRRRKVESFVWPAMLLSAIVGYRMAI